MADPNTLELVSRIEAELRRLGGRGGDVAAEDRLPRGWVAIRGGPATVFGMASEVLHRLQGADDLRKAIDGLPEVRPVPSSWPSEPDLIPGIGPAGLGLAVLGTNAGLRWGTTRDRSLDNLGLCGWFPTSMEALDAAWKEWTASAQI